jgi:CheY-like chemotaxis protein/transcription termination factor NusB
VARILVADDNSNIQKMVGLALKDQGIDVIAVGNGEAAVRKIADLRPDLVLADVFMPVRNGYEVCKFVKDDSSLAHIPVILLVGAFDPLDEQEAQRVGADGVLKKPFVPPDPLISMVKSALQRASAAQTAAGIAEKAAVPVMAGGPSTAGRASSTPAASVSPTVFAAPRQEAPVESFVEEVPATPETLKIESAGKPLAFGSLLETPAAEPDDAAFVAPPNPELADRDWSAAETDEVEEEEEESASSSWRRDGGSEDFAPDPAGEAAADKATARAKRRESWTPTREKTQDLLEEATAPEIIVAPKPSVSYGAPVPQNSFAAPKPEPPLEPKKIEEVPAPRSVEIAPPVIAKAPEPAAPETAKPSGGNAWFSTTNSPWEAEAQKANQLASGWDAPPAPSASSASETVVEEPALPEPSQLEAVQAEAAPTYDFVSEAPSEEPVHYVPEPELVQNEVVAHSPLPDLISDGSISPETVESIRQETSYALESVSQAVAKKPAESAVKIAEAQQQDMDALVANVLAKMSPEMLQAVTREILKPVVAAMIRDEINAKKS